MSVSKLCPWVRICSVRSLLSGRDFESYRWPQNLVTSSFCVSPTYIRSQTLHLAAYTISDVRHVPPAATFTSCPDFVFCKTSLLLISLQIEHPPQGSVGPLLFWGGWTSFLMIWLLTVFLRRKATIGGSLNKFLNSWSCCKMWWCFLIIPGNCVSVGCQSHAKTTRSFFWFFTGLPRISSLDFWLTSLADLINFSFLYPRFMKYSMYRLHWSMKSEVSLHILLNRRNWDFGILSIMCLGWFDCWLR